MFVIEKRISAKFCLNRCQGILRCKLSLQIFFLTEGKKGFDFLNASSAHLCFGSITVETSEQRVALIFFS